MQQEQESRQSYVLKDKLLFWGTYNLGRSISAAVKSLHCKPPTYGFHSNL